MIDGPFEQISAQHKLSVFMDIANDDQAIHETVEKEFKQLVNSIIYIKKKS